MTSLLVLLGGLFTAAPVANPSCVTTASAESLAKRASPLDSVSFSVGAASVKICYGRPSLRGRQMIGGSAHPFGKLWRTGANEPTTIHTTAPIVVAGIKVPAGATSLYTVPGETTWEVVLNGSTEQWGDEGSYDNVKATEIGRAKLTASRPGSPIEQFTIRPESKAGTTILILEWEMSRIAIPVEPVR